MPAAELARVAKEYQDREVLPRCATCERPCCRLDTLALELDWKRVRVLWGVEHHRSTFDAALARGRGPPDIRTQGGFYYAFGRVCPAYDEAGRTCRIYDTPLKPDGCGDFPVYEEDGQLVADLRCEAVDVEELKALLRRELGPQARLSTQANPDFPFLVSIGARRGPSRPRTPTPARRPRG